MSASVYILSVLMIFGKGVTNSEKYFTNKTQCEKYRNMMRACVVENESVERGFFGNVCMLDTKGEYRILKDCEEVLK